MTRYDNNSIVIPEKPQALSGIQSAATPSRSVAALLLGCAALLMAPQAALADNECDPVLVDPSVNGATADSYTCDQAEYDDGVTYDANGDLTVTFTPNISEIGETNGSGISLAGDGIENIDFDSATNNSELESRNTVGPLLDVSTVDGDIDIMTEEIDADGQNPAGVTHGIRAIASGGGSVDIATTGNVDVLSNNNPVDAIAIEAASLGGGDVTLTMDGNGHGRQHAIRAETVGGGAITINLLNGEFRVDTGTVIRTIASGDTVINFSGGRTPFIPLDEGVVFADMSATAGTTTTLNLDAPESVGAVFDGSSGRTTTDNTLLVGAGGGDFVINNNSGLYGGIDFSAATGDITFNNAAKDETHPDAKWAMADDVFSFGGGDDTVNNLPGAVISTGAPSRRIANFQTFETPVLFETTLDFGLGVDRFNNAGTLMVSESYFAVAFPPTGGGDPIFLEALRIASEVTLPGLETFDNSGLIVMGGFTERSENAPLASEFVDCTDNHNIAPFGPTSCLEFSRVNDSDWEWNDVLAMPGTSFIGSEGSRILLDAALHLGRPQNDCYTGRAGVEDFFRLPGADCIDLTGGSTAGSTAITVRQRQGGDHGAYNPEGMVIIDVGGGSSAAEHFVLSPDSDQYDPRLGGFVNKGMFMYVLAYDEGNQQHRLVGVPSEIGKQMPLLVQGAQEVSRTATTAWRDRRTHARTALGGETDHGVWAHVSQTRSEREPQQSLSVYSRQIDFGDVNDFDQDTLTLTLGKDFIFGNDGETAWVAGGTLGYSRSQLDFDASPIRKNADIEGAMAGIYGSFETGRLFVDAALNYGTFALDDDVPELNAGGGGELRSLRSPFERVSSRRQAEPLDTDVYTLGAYAEGGMRFEVGELFQVEPLAALSFASADFDGMHVPSADPERPGNEVFGDGAHDSLRGGLGARLRADSAVGNLLLRYSLTGRVWEEFEDETEVRIASEGPDATVTDEFGGTFTDLRAGVSLSDPAGMVSGYLNLDATTGDDYDSLGISAGFRYQW